jgi:hypothetical protein
MTPDDSTYQDRVRTLRLRYARAAAQDDGLPSYVSRVPAWQGAIGDAVQAHDAAHRRAAHVSPFVRRALGAQLPPKVVAA